MIGIVVYGPEASGTRYVTRLLEAASMDPANVVRHCSLPYGTRFVPLDELMGDIDRNDTRVVLTSRRADLLALSQVANGHAADWRAALLQARRAYGWAIGEALRLQVPFLLTSYEAFDDLAYRTWVCDWALDEADHAAAEGFGFVDGNEKYR